MGRIAIVTDSNSGITQAQAKSMGVHVLPMPFNIQDVCYYEGINLSGEEFYQKLQEGSDICTSQPSPEAVIVMWEELLLEHEEIIHIPMSSALSGSCQTALMLSKDFDHKVQVVNNQRISVTQRQSVLDAMDLVRAGKGASEIREILEKTKQESSIYITLDTLLYLKKGGRITPAAAAIGTFLKLKPVLQIQGEKLDAYAKARTMKQAKTMMMTAIDNDIKNRFAVEGEEIPVRLFIAHTNNEEAANEWREEIEKEYPGYEVYVDHLSLSVACHLGPGALAFACAKKIQY